MLPPMVPRLRTCGSPISAAASAIIGHVSRNSFDAAISVCVVVAPISMRPPASLMPESPGILEISTSVPGSLRRSFINGTRLCPPAITLPPFDAASFAIASSTEDAR